MAYNNEVAYENKKTKLLFAFSGIRFPPWVSRIRKKNIIQNAGWRTKTKWREKARWRTKTKWRKKQDGGQKQNFNLLFLQLESQLQFVLYYSPSEKNKIQKANKSRIAFKKWKSFSFVNCTPIVLFFFQKIFFVLTVLYIGRWAPKGWGWIQALDLFSGVSGFSQFIILIHKLKDWEIRRKTQRQCYEGNLWN